MTVFGARRRAFVIGAAVATLLAGFAAPAAASQDGIDGVITNARTGEPLAGASVTAYTQDFDWAGSSATDDAGHYDITPLAPGEYRLFATASGMVDQWAYGKVNSWEADPVTSPGNADLALAPIEYGSLAGRFVTPAGQPVANTLVQVYTTDQNQRDSTATDADGAFRFTGLETGGYKLRFTAPGGSVQWAHQKEEFQFDEAATFTVEADTETVVTETAFPMGALDVTVLDAGTAEPVAGACVSTLDGPQQVSGCTDAAGTARIAGIRTGTYHLAIDATGYLRNTVADVVVSDGATTPAAARLTKASVVALSIKDTRGRPVSGACVALLEVSQGAAVPESQHCSGTDGKVRFDQFPNGRYRAFVHTSDSSLGAQWVGRHGGVGDAREAKVFTTEPGATKAIPVKLDRAGSITGVVRAADGNAPVEGVCPAVTPQFPNGPGTIDTVCSQADGWYTIRGLGPYQWPVEFPDFSGRYAWVWSGNVADRYAAKPITVRAGRSVTANAALPAAGKVTGTVHGATLPNQWITIVAINTRTGDVAAPYAVVRGEAEYTLSGLATQRIWIDFNAGPGSDLTRHPDPVPVTAGQTTHLDLTEPA